jgi:apolipoprotein N-acyltransferase
MDSKLKNFIYMLVAIAASGAAYFYGTGLHPHWYFAWLAPLPILVMAPRVTRWPAVLAAFTAFLIAGLDMWSYYRVVTPLPVTLIVLLLPSVLFALVVLAYRAFVVRGALVRAAFAFPVLWVAVEYLSEFGSPHSTFGNMAYTQMNCLPIIQVAAITGIWGISFLLFLLPASIAAMTALHTEPKQKRALAAAVAVVFVAVLGYGYLRLHRESHAQSVVVGLVDSDARGSVFPGGTKAVELVGAYTAQVPGLARQGARVIVMPEKIGRLSDEEIQEADRMLMQSARQNSVTIVAGFQHLPNRNEARVYAADGTLEATYEKHHMLPIFEAELVPGKTLTVLNRPTGKWGLTICKDMDFPQLSTDYAKQNAGLLLVPAWDFVEDGWLHGRMGILRGVESGFSIARTAKQGILTVSDNRGRVLAERVTGASTFDTLVAMVPVESETTFYDRAGDWFAWVDLTAAAVLLFWPRRKRRPAISS